MDQKYTQRVAETKKAKAIEYAEHGDVAMAVKSYEAAAKAYNELASADIENMFVWRRKADECIKLSKALLQGPATVPSTPKTGNSKGNPSKAKDTSAVAPAPFAPKQADGATKEVDYSKYQLNICRPSKTVTFNDLVGIEDAKERIMDLFIGPIQDPEAYRRYNLSTGGRLMLEGPPGTGKSSLAQAIASELDYAFVSVSGSDLIDKYLGETEKGIKNLFEELRRYVREEGEPIVLFIDEFDSMTRQSGDGDKTGDVAVPELKKQLEGFDSNNDNILIIVATNYPEQMDTTILNRFERVVVPLPNAEAREIMLKKRCEKAKLDPADMEQLDFKRLAELSDGMAGRDIVSITDRFLRKLVKRNQGKEKIEGSLMSEMEKMILDRKKVFGK